MKKQLFSILTIAAFGIALAGCGKSEDPATPLALNTAQGTAKIIGFVYYTPSEQIPAPKKAIPADKLVPTVTFNNAVFSTGTGVTDITGNFRYVNGTGADAGKFEIDVPAPTNGTSMSVTIKFASFIGTQTGADGTTVTNGAYTAPAAINQTVTAGQTIILLPASSFTFASGTVIAQ